jgi:hypothetical protein
MAVSTPRAAASGVTKIMVAMIAVLAIILVVMTTLVLRVGSSSVDTTVETAAVADIHTTFAYTYGLAQFVEAHCGPTPTKSLTAASDAEKQADAALYARARAEAEARAQTITTGKSCDYVISEIQAGERRAAAAHY